MRSGAQLAAAMVVLTLPGHAVAAGTTAQSPHPLVGYFAALEANDFELAMSYRCEAARVAAEHSKQFMSEVDRIEVDYDSLTSAVIEAIEVPGGWESVEDVPTHAVYEYRFRTDGGLTEPSWLATVVEDEEERLCGWAGPRRVEFEALPRLLQATQLRVVDVEVMLTASIPDFELVEHREIDVSVFPETSPASAATSGWTTAWKHQTFGGMRVSFLQFPTTDGALATGRYWLDGYGSVVELIDIDVPPGAQAFRYLPSAWTWIQTRGAGPECDRLALVATQTLVEVAVCGLAPDEDHAVLLELAAKVAAVL